MSSSKCTNPLLKAGRKTKPAITNSIKQTKTGFLWTVTSSPEYKSDSEVRISFGGVLPAFLRSAYPLGYYETHWQMVGQSQYENTQKPLCISRQREHPF